MYSNRNEVGEQAAESLLATATTLLESPLTPLSDDAVVELTRQVERGMRMLAAVQHRLAVEISERSIPSRAGVKTLKRFLMQTLRLSSGDAGSRVNLVDWVGTRHDTAGECVDPPLLYTAKALAAGEISIDHVRGVVAVMNRVPRTTAAEDREAAEQVLAEFARSGSPDDIAKIGDRILTHLDPDGRLTDDHDRARMRGIILGRQRPDGMSPIRGEITPTLRALLDPILAKYARPGVCNPDDPASPAVDPDHVDPDRLAAAAARDHRSAAQRTHDALLALVQSGVISTELGTHRGMSVTTVLTMNLADVEQLSGVATTATGGTLPIREALRLAEKSQPFLAVFDHAGLPLHLGRTRRLATRTQRLALIAALHGCSRPGCDAPASLCAVHHVLDYRKGGRTDLSNLTLACDPCHALVHDGPGGWKTVPRTRSSRYPGRTAWIAPTHIDPTGTPQVNHRHHASELLAQALTHLHQRNERNERSREQHHQRPPTPDSHPPPTSTAA
ncbi:DUF222 domain-containing protein [Nocardia sp. NPDC051570]|uniref:HNH endonuclease signature motif containing protein n=1 Tax=Nocardia sp. NPDC051570 TaxID=3364324 RepID=UPI0037A79D24